jgi:hypothetical protein
MEATWISLKREAILFLEAKNKEQETKERQL